MLLKLKLTVKSKKCNLDVLSSRYYLLLFPDWLILLFFLYFLKGERYIWYNFSVDCANLFVAQDREWITFMS